MSKINTLIYIIKLVEMQHNNQTKKVKNCCLFFEWPIKVNLNGSNEENQSIT